MPARRTLKDLPAHLKKYKYAATPVSTPPPDDKCIACWRKYNTIDDPSDPNESPCCALRLSPCNHLIGSLCLHELLRRGFPAACPQCTQQIAIVHSTVPRWIEFFLRHDKSPLSPSFWIAGPRMQANYRGRARLNRSNELHARLFNGTLGLTGGVELWRYYLDWPFKCTRWVLVLVFLMHNAFWSLEKALTKLPVTESTYRSCNSQIFPSYSPISVQ